VIVALIDYRAGNLTSVRKALASLGAEILTPTSPDDLERADAIIVPGVGHFEATAALDVSWRETMRQRLGAGVPLLGICLGQQFLFEGSEEAPGVPGLGVLRGQCVRLDPSAASAMAKPDTAEATADSRAAAPAQLKVPHVGWNALKQTGRRSRLLAGIEDEAQAYFTHSYVAPDGEATIATTTHGVSFASVVEQGLVFGAQFHPEKSGEVGLRMLKNFLDVAREQRTALRHRQFAEVEGRTRTDEGHEVM
jgi:imidazole glycerol-phosphate synthase subunit HisH